MPITLWPGGRGLTAQGSVAPFVGAPIAGASPLWSDPRLAWGVAVLAVLMLAGTWLLARRRRGKRNTAAILCAVASIALHGLLIWLLPLALRSGGGPIAESAPQRGTPATIRISAFSDPELSDVAASNAESGEAEAGDQVMPQPLPVAARWLESVMSDLAAPSAEPGPQEPLLGGPAAEMKTTATPAAVEPPPLEIPDLPEAPALEFTDDRTAAGVDQILSDLLSMYARDAAPAEAANPTRVPPPPKSLPETLPATAGGMAAAEPAAEVAVETSSGAASTAASGPSGRVLGDVAREFANRQGAARRDSLLATGGDEQSEAAVAAGLQWLAQFQRADGAWDPRLSDAGIERSPLGHYRGGAGSRATTGLTGLALLSMLGSGQTHQQGQHADSVRRGLQYLLSVQLPDGSLAGEATVYERTYCHGMAALAMGEAAAMSGDAVAAGSAKSAVGFTLRAQHPVTGGWRYVPGDPGDLSQLGWQVMALASGRAAGVPVPEVAIERTRTFLRSVRAGKTGGLASYKPGEAPSRTMTAEALATRLLIGETVPQAEIDEAEAYLLEELPGTAQDNYYYWYYASLALHQLQDEAWRKWNAAMKARLIETQLPDGSWSTATVWGGNGGKVYTTAMACLCLEVYYRHLTEGQRGVVARRR